MNVIRSPLNLVFFVYAIPLILIVSIVERNISINLSWPAIKRALIGRYWIWE